ncbi:MAG: hypothetical protein IPK79_12320 [Vampirovibrionales bacterium]|nr:hypothetical protein [Vampirovibrionales bacterium]
MKTLPGCGARARSVIVISAIVMSAASFCMAEIGAWADPPTPNETPLPAPGERTRGGGTGWKLVSFPLRLATAAMGAGLGALQGGYEGVAAMETSVAEETFGRADRNPMLVPVGVAGALIALPVGAISGAPRGASHGLKEGWRWWDRY